MGAKHVFVQASAGNLDRVRMSWITRARKLIAWDLRLNAQLVNMSITIDIMTFAVAM